MITLIAAMDEERVIGYEGSIPWHIKEDLQHFKEATINKPVIMGRKTYESLKGPLSDRLNIVVSSNPNYLQEHPEVRVIQDLGSFLKRIQKEEAEYMIIGGASIYQESLPYADKIILSLIKGKHDGDTFFPEFESSFKLESQISKGDFSVLIYKR